MATGLSRLLTDTYYSVGFAAVYPFSPAAANQWYGQSAQNLVNTAQTAYDFSAAISYGLTSPFAPEGAYQAYGDSMARLEHMAPSLYGGDDKSTAYQVTYGTLNAAAMLFPIRGGTVAQVTPKAYSVAFETQLARTELGLSRGEHFQIANQALQAERAINPALADLVSAPVGSRIPPADWTWQHATIDQGAGRAGVIQLVPRAQHTPGSAFWPLLHPLPGRAGGYSQWAIPAGAPPN